MSNRPERLAQPDSPSGPEGAGGFLIEDQRDTDLFTGSLQEAMAAMLDSSDRKRYARLAQMKGETYSMDKGMRDYVAILRQTVEASKLDCPNNV